MGRAVRLHDLDPVIGKIVLEKPVRFALPIHLGAERSKKSAPGTSAAGRCDGAVAMDGLDLFNNAKK